MNNNLENIKLDTLNPEEKELMLKILKELKETGKSDTLIKWKYKDYNEVPVDIETFLTDDKYLGIPWKDAQGKSKLFPFWLEQLKKLFPTNVTTAYNTFLESGARGIGKSEVAVGAASTYLMYRLLCLKNPLEHYHLKPTDKIVFSYLNIKINLAEKIAEDKFQKTVQMSPWFMARGTMTKKNNKPYWIPPDPLEIVVGSQADDTIGKAVYFSYIDEISFIKNQDVEEQKKKALDMIDTALGGMRTRFIYNGQNPTLLVVSSSKRSEQSFMETYIRQLQETQPDETLIIDEPIWNVKPKGTFKEETFFIGLGNKKLENIIIPDSERDNLEFYEKKGYRLIEAPVDFRAAAEKGLDRMLCDYAGESSFSSNKFISSDRLADSLDTTIQNPFPDKIKVGNDKQDDLQYSDFFDLNKVDKRYINKPLYIHLDMSVSGDKTGIAGVWIIGKKPTSDGGVGKDLIFQPAFSVSVEAPKGSQVSFEKNRNFIRWLKKQSFKIKEITTDTFQSYDLRQQLESEGFTCSILSVDRVEVPKGEKVGICVPYEYFKNTLYEGRFKMYETELLYNELVLLEKNNANGKVDHPPKGSKDQADAIVGATFTASKYAEDYAYDFGEDLDLIIKVNKSDSPIVPKDINWNKEIESVHSLFNSQVPKNANGGTFISDKGKKNKGWWVM